MSKVHFNVDLRALVGVDGEMLPLRPQTSDVLRLLIDNAGKVVSKDQIVNAIWGGRAVSDDSVYQCISEIRRALEQFGETKITTISKSGYLIDESLARADSSISLQPLTIKDAESIRYVASQDCTRIAWSASGKGIPVLKAPNWISHLGAERRSQLYAPFYDRLGRMARVVRYDQRGGGLSSWYIPPLTIEAMKNDMLAVADAAGLDQFYILGISQGVAFSIAFAFEYPDRVLGIIGRGGYALGDLAGGSEKNRKTYESAIKLAQLGWESDDPTFRRNFTSRIAPDANPEMAKEFDELQRISIPVENLIDFIEFDARLDITKEARGIKCPVLLIHSEKDRMVPVEDGRYLSMLLSNCQFETIPGENHTMVPDTPGFFQGMKLIEDFLGMRC